LEAVRKFHELSARYGIIAELRKLETL